MSGLKQIAKWGAVLALVLGMAQGEAEAQAASGTYVNIAVNGQEVPGDAPGRANESVVLDYSFESVRPPTTPGGPTGQLEMKPVRLLLNRGAAVTQLLNAQLQNRPVQFTLSFTQVSAGGVESTTFEVIGRSCTVSENSLYDLQGAGRQEISLVCGTLEFTAGTAQAFYDRNTTI